MYIFSMILLRCKILVKLFEKSKIKTMNLVVKGALRGAVRGIGGPITSRCTTTSHLHDFLHDLEKDLILLHPVTKN